MPNFPPAYLLPAFLASRNKRADGLMVLAGVLFTLAFAPFNLAYCAPLSLTLLFASWRTVSPLRAALRGYAFGLGSFGLGVSWVYVSIHDFGGVGFWPAALVSLLFCCFWALFPALAGLLSALGRRPGVPSGLTVPLVWVLVEFVRGYLLLGGFPWLLAAYSQMATPLAGYIPLLGVYGTGFLLVVTAWAVLHGLAGTAKRVRWPWLLLVSVWIVGGLLQRLTWTTPAGPPLQVTLLQGNISQDQKWRPENRLNSLRLYRQMTTEHWESQLIIWPETAIPVNLSVVDDFFIKPLAEDAKAHHTDVLVSLPEDSDQDGTLYNSAMLLGQEPGVYRKNHLLPFGETMPWRPFSTWVMTQLHLDLGDLSAGGGQQPLLKTAGYAFATSICYEDAFGEVAIAGLPAAAFLVNVTNDAWFGRSLEPYQHLQIATMRALETGRYLLRATNTGVTAVVAPNGTVVAQAPLFTQTALTTRITPMQGRTPYSYWGDVPVAGLLLLGWLLAGLMARRQAGQR